MSVIDSIQISGVTYTIQGSGGGGNPTVELTQAQYDALVTAGTVQADTYYIITDATAFDPSNYYTTAETQSAITEATSGKANSSDVYLKSETSGATEISTALANKQTTLTAGTGIDITDNVISVTGGGGSVTVDSGITSGSTNAVENRAIWSATTYNKDITLDFDSSSNSTNYPSGCTKVKITVGENNSSNVNFYNGSTMLGNAFINNWGSISVSLSFDGASYDIVNNEVIVTYPTVTTVTSISKTNGSAATVKAVIEGGWIADNTYMKSEVDAKLSKKLDASAYTPIVVDSQLNVASTNPLQNQALYNELVIEGGETETTLTFSSDGANYISTNYPSGCTKVKVSAPAMYNAYTIYFNNGSTELGSADISNWSSISVSLSFDGASYEVANNEVIVTYPTVTTVNNISYGAYVTAPDSVKAVTTSTTHVINQVTANTTALGGLKLVKLTQSAYDALSPNYDSNTLYVIVN